MRSFHLDHAAVPSRPAQLLGDIQALS